MSNRDLARKIRDYSRARGHAGVDTTYDQVFEDALTAELDAGAPPPPPPPPDPGPTTLPPREKIYVASGPGIEITGGGGQGGVSQVIENKEYIYTGPPGTGAIGIRIIGPRPSVIIRNVIVRGFWQDIVVDGFDGWVGTLLLEDTVATDAGGAEKSVGLFLYHVTKPVFRRVLLSHNGTPDIYSHNGYVDTENGPVDADDCVFANAGSHALMARCGATIRNSVLYGNPIGMQFGGGQDFVPGGVLAYAYDNVILRGTNISPHVDHKRGWGMWFGNIKQGEIARNILRDGIGSSTCRLVLDASAVDRFKKPGVGVLNLKCHDNLALNWADVYVPGTGPTTGTTVSWLPVTSERLAVNLYTPELTALLSPTLPRPSAAAYCKAMRVLMGMAA